MINNKIFITILSLLAILLIVGAIIRVLTPPEPQLPITPFQTTNTDGSTTTFLSVQYTGPTFTPQQTSLPILSVTKLSTTEQSVVDQIISRFSLQKKDGVDGVWENPNGTILVKNVYKNQYSLFISVPTEENEQEAQKAEAQQLISAAQKILQTTFPELTLTTQEKLIASFEGGTDPEPTSFDKGFYFQIPFYQGISGVPVILDKSSGYPFTVTVDKNGSIRSVVFVPIFLETQSLGEKKIIPLETALENIKKGNAAIVEATFINDPETLNLNSFTNVSLDSVQLQYRYNPDIEIISPYFLFVGEGSTGQNQLMKVQIITPAVLTEYTP